MFRSILDFWFSETDPQHWWLIKSDFASRLMTRFPDVLNQARQGELSSWRRVADGRLAEILVLDQFSRIAFHGTPQAYAQDGMALVLLQEAIRSGADLAFRPEQRQYLYLPFLHSESLLIHQQAERMFERLALPRAYECAKEHRKILERFGRYPHRNAILGRESTPQEQEFLQHLFYETLKSV